MTHHLDIETAIKLSRQMWAIGDWLNYGEGRYGKTYVEAVEATGYEYQTLANAKHVSASFEFSLRRENLHWSHHKIVAALPIEERTGHHKVGLDAEFGAELPAIANSDPGRNLPPSWTVLGALSSLSAEDFKDAQEHPRQPYYPPLA